MPTPLPPRRPLALLSVALLLAACGGTQATDTPAAQPAAQATSAPAAQPAAQATSAPAAPAAPAATAEPAAPAAPSGDAKEAVLAAVKAQLTSGPYRSVITSVSDGKTSETVAEFVPPSSLRVVISGEGVENEVVVVGDQMWTRQGAEWIAMPGGGPQIAATLAAFAEDPESRGILISNAQYVGPDVVDGTPTWVYSYDTTYGEDPQAPQSKGDKLWVSVASGLPLKQEGTVELGGVKTTSTSLVTYDPGLTIAPPVQ